MNTKPVFFCANIFLVKQSVEISRLSPLTQATRVLSGKTLFTSTDLKSLSRLDPTLGLRRKNSSMQNMDGENKSPPLSSDLCFSETSSNQKNN